MKTLMTALLLSAPAAMAQSPATDGPVLASLALEPTASFSFFHPAGSIRLVGWDRDSIVVRGHGSRKDFFFGGSRTGGKMGVEARAAGDSSKPIHLVVYFPRRGSVNVKTATADITASDLSGRYSAVAGSVRVTGSVSSLDVETMSGNLDVQASTPWLRARTGQGHLLIRGSPQDVDASTVGGALDIATSTILRGRFASVTGDIRYAATPAPSALADFSSHGGTIDFLLPRNVSGRFDISSVTGEIANGFTQVSPAAVGPHRLRLNLGRGEAQFTVRTFKGTVRLRPE
jgi:hypothetical protein